MSMKPSLIWFTNACMIAGLALSIAVLATAWLSPRVKRIPTWFNLFISGIIFSISFMLLMGAQNGPPPRFEICLFQAMMTYASPALTAYASAAFCVELLLLSMHVLRQERSTIPKPKGGFILIGFPYLVFIGVAIEVLAMGLMDPSLVRRDEDTSMYCHLKSHIPSRVTSGLSLIGIVIALSALGFTIDALYRRRHDPMMRQFRHETKAHRMVARMVIFGILPVIGLLISVLKFPPKVATNAVFVVIMSLLPLWSAIVLGSQADIIRVWIFWKRGLSPQSSRILSDSHELTEFESQTKLEFVPNRV